MSVEGFQDVHGLGRRSKLGKSRVTASSQSGRSFQATVLRNLQRGRGPGLQSTETSPMELGYPDDLRDNDGGLTRQVDDLRLIWQRMMVSNIAYGLVSRSCSLWHATGGRR